MEFKVEQKKLDAALAAVSGALKDKVIPVLANILIESVGEGWIRLTATDIDVMLRYDCEAEIITSGAICIEGRKLIDITKALPSGIMYFTQEPNAWVRMLSGRGKYRFAGIEGSQFPEPAYFPDRLMPLSLKIMQDMIKRTAFAMEPPKGSAHARQGVRFEMTPTSIRAVATDSHSLPIADAIIEDGEDLIFLLPAVTVPEVLKLAGDEISVGLDENHIFIECGNLRMALRQVIGIFPDYERAIPHGAKSTVSFNAVELADVVARVSAMGAADLRKAFLTLSNDEITVKSRGGEGEGEDIIPAALVGNPITLGFNVEELLKILKVFDGRTILHFKDNRTPVIFTPEGQDDYQCIATLAQPPTAATEVAQ